MINVGIYFQNKDYWQRQCRAKFVRSEGPIVPGIHKLIVKVQLTGFTVDRPKHGHSSTLPTPENIEDVVQSVRENALTLIRHRAQELNG